MHHNIFLIFILLNAVLGTTILTCRKILLKRFTVIENLMFDLIFVSSFLLLIVFLMLDKKAFFKKVKDGVFKKSLPLIVCMSLLIGISIFLGFFLIKTTDVSYFYSLRTGTRIVLITLVGYFLFSEKITLQKIIGITLILAGIIMVHSGSAKNITK